MDQEINNCLGLISIDPENHLFFSDQNNSLYKTSKCIYAKNQLCISYLPTTAYINTQITISKNIDEEDLYDILYTKVYEELALDQAIGYKIRYLEVFNFIDEKNRKFHVFIADPKVIDDIFEQSVQKLKYIDFIVPLPLLFKTLYTKKILNNTNNADVFLYFLDNDAFITVYGAKEFLYAKPLNYSLNQMYARFCELYGKKIEYNKFTDIIRNENLKLSQNDFVAPLLKLYREIFASINDIFNFVKKAHNVSKINALYIGSQFFMQTKLDEIAQIELNVKSYPLDFNYGFQDAEYIDPLEYLMHLYAKQNEDERYECNFTLYDRPPKLIKRQSGKILLISAASFLIAFIYPIFYWSLGYLESLKYDQIKQQNRILLEKRLSTQAALKEKKAKEQRLLALLKIEKQNYQTKKTTLLQIHRVKIDYPMKAKILYNFTKNFNRYNVMLSSLSYDEEKNKRVFVFDLISNKNRDMTRLLEDIMQRYKGQFAFTLQKISFDHKSNKYFTKLTAVLL